MLTTQKQRKKMSAINRIAVKPQSEGKKRAERRNEKKPSRQTLKPPAHLIVEFRKYFIAAKEL